MSDKNISTIHWNFWTIVAIALVWNVMGVVNFFMQMNPDVLAMYPESERAIIEARPLWATAGFALAVFGGAIGCIFLLFKKQVSLYFFIGSLIGVLVTMIHTLSIGIDFAVAELLGIILMPVIVAAFLIWYTLHVQGKSWLR